jgi:hypothetical protein
MTPLIHAIAKDGSSHLFGTHSPYRSVVLVEFEAGLFERQAAVVQQTPNLALGVRDKVLVNDAVDASRQHFVEMTHQLDVVAVIEAKIGWRSATAGSVASSADACSIVAVCDRDFFNQLAAAAIEALEIVLPESDGPGVAPGPRSLRSI